MCYKHVLKWYRTLSKFKSKLHPWDSIPNVLQTHSESDSNVIYLSTASVSSAGPPELALVAFFFLAFELAFKRFLEVVLEAGLAEVLVLY